MSEINGQEAVDQLCNHYYDKNIHRIFLNVKMKENAK